VKAPVDALYAYLLDAHARGRRTVVIVDEAQHLTAEVLEQLRLLTNLETGKAKLLQIILIGQPELVELMSRTDLRQVAQRVAARYHLAPLTERDTGAYVAHRMAMAGRSTMIFDEAAIRAVHQAAGGVPRLINVICDRALLGAYAQHSERVTEDVVRRAAHEIAGENTGGRDRRRRRVAIAAAVAVVVLATAAVVVARPPMAWLARMAPSPSPSAPVAAAMAPPPAVPAAPVQTASLDSVVTDVDGAYSAIAARWGRQYERRPGEQPCDAIRRSGLACLARHGTWNLVRRFDVPVVLELASPSGLRFVAVVSADEGHATVQAGGRIETIALDRLEREWDGSFVLLWHPPRAGIEPIGRGATAGDVAWLRERLAVVDGQPAAARTPARYDDALAAQLTAFQRAHGLHPDGVAGEETLARLTAIADPATPSLRRTRTGQ